MGFRWYPGRRMRFERDAQKALGQTADAIVSDLKARGAIPRDTGQLEDSTTTDLSRLSRGTASVVSSTPYARRLYYGLGYRFSRAINPSAGPLWFQPYIDGSRSKWVRSTFEELLRRARA